MDVRKRLLLRPQDFAPSCDELQVVGAFNPGVAEVNGEILLLVRVAQRPVEQRSGWVGLPRWEQGEIVIDWHRCEDVHWIDPRVVRLRQTGLVRLSFVSDLRVARCRGFAIERIEPCSLRCEEPWEEFGIEDPRITRIDGRYYITYVAVSHHGAATALASTSDFVQLVRHGIIFPPENKDVVLFPELIDGSYAAMHRPNGATPFTRPQMWTARSPDLLHWGGHRPLALAGAEWAKGRVGAGAPPIPFAGGWLEIYHGNRQPAAPGEVGDYVAAAVLLDRDNPSKIIRQPAAPLLEPTEDFERKGFVANVVFPTGVVARNDALLVYYGASDMYCAVAEIPRRAMENFLDSS